ncbi:carotenoid oxygenase family protein [Halorussus amylolyticus]|uniref:carotenoid oxygenase family protein n=1 Tax=Halorussus amylolyticus TaxID=1126242 RepID=UPI00104BE469|nr:carotenoid oxygenase family protein [Halorussus amylolyticus]
MRNTWRQGLESQLEEVSNERLQVEGSFPPWLDGTLIVNGPGVFEVGNRPLNHWFDALAMLRGFRIRGDTVRYTNRLVRSEDFRVASQEGRVRRPLPGTPADGSALRRLYLSLAGGFQDNPSIGVVRLDGSVYAVTESPIGIEIGPHTLRTVGRRDLTAGLDADATLGHTHVEDDVQWGLAPSFGRRPAYTLFRREPNQPPEALTRLRFGSHPPYVHAFALTERYAVVPEGSFGVDFRALLRGVPWGRTFLDAFERREATPRFHVIDRETGARTAAIPAEPFFVYHFANAFETGETIAVDCVVYDDLRAITGLTVENLRSDDPTVPRGDFVRYRLPLTGGRAERETLYTGPAEFPTINYAAVNGRKYEYAYLATIDRGSLPTAIAKVRPETTETSRWSRSGVHPGEPLFVPDPDGDAEDDGVLLSLALDSRADRSVLFCLDATTLTERARAILPHRLPVGFHGQFYDATDPQRLMQ